MSNDYDEVDRAMATGCITAWSIPIYIVSSFGWCWLITWFLNLRNYRALAATSGAGDWTPYIAGAIAILPLMLLSYIRADFKRHQP